MKTKKLCRFFSLIITITMIVSLSGVQTYAKETSIKGINGTIITLPDITDDFTKIEIRTSEDLKNLASLCSLDTASEKLYVELKNDISLKGEDFVPIPFFGGIFDGKDYTISGLSTTNTSEPVGLFATVGKNALIENLTVKGSLLPSESCNFLGGIAGENKGIIYNCSFVGVVAGSSYVGGIAGRNAKTGIIANCDSNGAVRAAYMTGGIAGINNGTILDCENLSLINTENADGGVNVSDIDIEFTLDLSKISRGTGSAAQMDMGGIAGYSSGIISGCTNRQEIGYLHTGYNVGGIAGRSSGYIHNCVNNAHVTGRKDIGGIVGQQEPYIKTTITESNLKVLSTQLDEMQSLMEKTKSDADSAGKKISTRVDKITDYVDDANDSASELTDRVKTEYDNVKSDKTVEDVTEKANDYLNQKKDQYKEKADNISKEDAEKSEEELYAAVSGLNAQIKLLNKEAAGYSDLLDSDLKAINDKYSDIRDTLYNIENTSFEVTDTSVVDVDLITLGAVRGCENRGNIEGDLNVAGISGAMGQESTVDPEDEISLSLDAETHKEYEYKAVIDGCVNNGFISTKRNYCAGISARAEVGYIKNCENYGEIQAGGSYAGGIAAEAEIVIRDCYSKCILHGEKNVGGIVGVGISDTSDSESSIVSGCRSLVTIVDASKFYGAIASTADGSFDNNIFVSDSLLGLGTVSMAGAAEPVDYETLVQGDVPDAFKTLKAYFVAGDTVLKTIDFEYGDSLDISEYPELPKKKGCFAKWDITELNNLTKDTRITAVYTTYISALSSADNRSTKRSVFYAEGDFSDDQILVAEKTQLGLYEVDRENTTDVYNFFFDRNLEEQWIVKIPEDGRDSHVLRYLPTGISESAPEIYVYSEGGWQKAETVEYGSYYGFEVKDTDIKVAVVTTTPVYASFAIAVGILVVLLTLLVVLIRAIHSSKKRRENAEKLREERIKEIFEESSGKGAEALTDNKELMDLIGGKNVKKPAEKKPVKKGRIVSRIIGFAVVVLILVPILLYLHNPSILQSKVAKLYVHSLIQDETGEYRVKLELESGRMSESVDSYVWRKNTDNGPVTAVESNGVTVYMSGDKLYLENGKAFAASEMLPDYDSAFDDIKKATDDFNVTSKKVDGGTERTISLSGDAAYDLVSYAMGEYASEVEAVNNVKATVVSDNWKIKAIRISCNGDFHSMKNANITCTIEVVEESDKQTAHEIPKSVLDAMSQGGDCLPVTKDMLDIMYAFGKFTSKDPQAAELRLSATGDVLGVSETLSWNRTKVKGEWISSVEKNGISLYYTDKGACTSRGVSLTDSQEATVSVASVFDCVYNSCLKGGYSYSEQNGAATYKLELAADEMEEVAKALAPDFDEYDVALKKGVVTVEVINGEISEINVRISGSVKLILFSKSIGLNLCITPMSVNGAIEIPADVINTLMSK